MMMMGTRRRLRRLRDEISADIAGIGREKCGSVASVI